ncbi:hypothetical protein HPB49_014339 [Dermacentor silvarum]|uniref:Uncharacterized protein n=1 Tax=Dermacentor silvarum TaxID=543639 RepID=A0ACB8CFD3_DERSI|nr:hypothetical protein HPB49_014339 [Dermacentor silvarum]
MFRHARNQVELQIAHVGDAGTSSSHGSGSSSSSSDSDVEALAGRRRTTLPATRRLGFQRLELHELHEVRQMQAAARRAADDVAACGDGAGTALDPLALPELALIDQPQECNGIEAIVRQGNWYMHPRFQAVLSTSATLCRIALLVDLNSTLWIRVKYRDLLRASTWREHVDLPLLCGWDDMARNLYRAAIRTSINKSRNPCDDFYGFVCDGWKHQHRFLSIVDAAEDAMYKHALNGIKRASQDSRNQAQAASSTSSIQERVAALARSYMESSSESSLQNLKRLMSDNHLSWRPTSDNHPLAILLDPSANGNAHLWFQVSISLSSLRVGSTVPVLKIVPSTAFRSWIASMRVFTGHLVGMVLWLRYQKYVRKMLHVFDVSESRSGEIVSTIEAMNRFTPETLGPAVAESEPRIVRMLIPNLTETATLGVSTRRLVLLFNEYLIWARRFSPSHIVQVENLALLRPVAYIFGLKAETKEPLTLSLGLRVAHELGWMARRETANVMLEIAGLPPSVHTRRCLVQIESTVGIGWLSLFPKHQESECFVRDMSYILSDAAARRSKALLQLRAHSTSVVWNSDSFPVRVLPEPSCTARLFIHWLKVMPGSLLSHRYSFHGALTVAEHYLVLPFYHSDLPPAVNYGCAGDLIADKVLTGLFRELEYNQSETAL